MSEFFFKAPSATMSKVMSFFGEASALFEDAMVFYQVDSYLIAGQFLFAYTSLGRVATGDMMFFREKYLLDERGRIVSFRKRMPLSQRAYYEIVTDPTAIFDMRTSVRASFMVDGDTEVVVEHSMLGTVLMVDACDYSRAKNIIDTVSGRIMSGMGTSLLSVSSFEEYFYNKLTSGSAASEDDVLTYAIGQFGDDRFPSGEFPGGMNSGESAVHVDTAVAEDDSSVVPVNVAEGTSREEGDSATLVAGVSV